MVARVEALTWANRPRVIQASPSRRFERKIQLRLRTVKSREGRYEQAENEYLLDQYIPLASRYL
jgi:hypothetical protein